MRESPPGFQYTSLEDALQRLSRALGPKSRRESVDVRVAYRRVLYEDVVAREDSPRKDTSHFDGYALASTDTLPAGFGSPVGLRVVGGPSPLGSAPRIALRSGQAAEVLTGGYLPAGADAVLPVEESSVLNGRIEVRRRVSPGELVYRAGADVRKGDLVLRRGKTLMGQDLVLLASLRFQRVAAFRRPRVSIVPTGNELTADIGSKAAGKVVESHSLLLEHLVEEAGGVPLVSPIVRDDARSMSRALKAAIRGSEIVLTLAGSSVGGPDLVDSSIRGFGSATTALVHGVKVNRGRVMGFAVVGGTPIVILPGPIQGALNAFIVFAYPLIRYHLGMGWEEPPSVSATVGEDWDASGKFKDFDQVVYLRLTRDPGSPSGLVATPSSAETEKVSFLVSNNAYTLVSGRDPTLTKGEPVRAHLLPGFSRLE